MAAVPIHYFLAFLCIKLTFCGPVKQKKFLAENFLEGVNPDCKSFPIPNENSTLLAADCVFPVPDLTDKKTVNHHMKFEVTDLMCYSALSNMMSLCPPGKEELAPGKDLGVDINSTKVETFCEEAASLKVDHDCSKLKKRDKEDCELLKKVVPVTVSNIDKCKEICIVEKELFSVCQYLYASTKALSQVLSEGVALKPTPKTVIPPAEIPKPPVGSSSKPSTIESQEKPSGEDKKDADHKGTAEGDGVKTTDDNDAAVNKTTDAIKNETNKDPNPTNKQPVAVPEELTTKTSTAKNARAEESESTAFGSSTSVGTSSFESSTTTSTTTSTTSSLVQEKAEDVKVVQADQQVQQKDNKNVPTTLKTKEPTSKPDNGKGGGKDDIEEIAEDTPGLYDDHQYNDKKGHSGPIVENTMQNSKSISVDDSSSSFFSYFILLSIVAIVAYLVFHNKQKILALILEGRRRQGSRRRSGGKEYRKLDSNLEDTMNSESYTSGQHVIY